MLAALLLACAPVVLRAEPPDAWFAVDGGPPVQGPVTLRRRPGGHRVEVRREGYRTVTLRVARIRLLRLPAPPGDDPGTVVLLVPEHGPAGTWRPEEVLP